MGQPIELLKATVLGDVAIFDTDRSLTGMDGYTYRTASDAAADSTLAARLAEQIYEVESGATNVFVYSNTVSVRRPGGWSDEERDRVGTLIKHFFIVYEENKAG